MKALITSITQGSYFVQPLNSAKKAGWKSAVVVAADIRTALATYKEEHKP